jgi:hypothetical protein
VSLQHKFRIHREREKLLQEFIQKYTSTSHARLFHDFMKFVRQEGKSFREGKANRNKDITLPMVLTELISLLGSLDPMHTFLANISTDQSVHRLNINMMAKATCHPNSGSCEQNFTASYEQRYHSYNQICENLKAFIYISYMYVRSY